MILRKLEVEGFRCFDRRVTLPELGEGLNILSGPNGAGKSTLLRALRHLLADSYSVSGAAVTAAMQPWGRAISPRIGAEFAHGGAEWRMEKRFLSGAMGRLDKLEGGVFRPVAEGKEADARVRAMLAAEAPGKGIAQEAHLGLLQVLWTPQGQPHLEPWSEKVKGRLGEIFGAALQSKEADRIAKLLGTRLKVYFTPSGQTPKNSPVNILQGELMNAELDAAERRADWERLSGQRMQLGSLRASVAEKTARVEQLRPLVDKAAEVEKALAEAGTAELVARQAFQQLDSRLTAWRADAGKAGQWEKELAEALEAERAAVARVEEETAHRPVVKELEARLEALLQSGQDAKQWPDVTRLAALTDEVAELQRRIEALRAPEEKQMRRMREFGQQLAVQRATLAAASLRVRVEAEAAIQLDGEGTLETGETREFVRPQRVELRIPGVARITAESANAQAAEAERDVARLAGELAQLLAGETPEEWERRFREAGELVNQLRAKAAELNPLQQKRRELDDLRAKHPEWAAAPPDVEQCRVDYLACREELKAAKAKFDGARLAADAATAAARRKTAEHELATVRRRLEEYAAAGPITDLESRHAAAATDLSLATARLKSLRDEAPAGAADRKLELERLNREIAIDREAAATLDGSLATLQSQNVYARLAEAEERVAAKSAELDRHKRRAKSLELLKTALDDANRDMTAAIPAQIGVEATAIWRRIAGDAAYPLQIGDSWTPAGLQVPDADAPLADLSGGEGEQIAFATRLALALALARDERQLAVFDDAFLATDPARAARILDLLVDASARLQILILTCHPERYAQLPAARAFDLEKLKQ